jgi:hypothetical protein
MKTSISVPLVALAAMLGVQSQALAGPPNSINNGPPVLDPPTASLIP